MKRFISFVLIAALLLPLCACGAAEKDTAAFYYRRAKFNYGSEGEDGVIGSEKRDIAGHSEDLPYLISLYLFGPQEDTLVSPFPAETRLLNAKRTANELLIQLSDVGTEFPDVQYTLACACLALTCLELTDATFITVVSGERSLRLSREDLTLLDSDTENPATIETTMEVPQ